MLYLNPDHTVFIPMKKLAALIIIAPLLASCTGSQEQTDYRPEYVKDTNGFDILMGQFAHNIENIWGIKEVLIAGPKDYVKYTDQYYTRSHINFDAGTVTIETLAGVEPEAHLRQAIINTLLMGEDRARLTSILMPTMSPSVKSRSCSARCWIIPDSRSAGSGAPPNSRIIW